jgi:hypothetical protein
VCARYTNAGASRTWWENGEGRLGVAGAAGVGTSTCGGSALLVQVGFWKGGGGDKGKVESGS